jgi:hypothetical protein
MALPFGQQFQQLLDGMATQFYEQCEFKNPDGTWKDTADVFTRLAVDTTVKLTQISSTAWAFKEFAKQKMTEATPEEKRYTYTALARLEKTCHQLSRDLEILFYLKVVGRDDITHPPGPGPNQ